MFQGLPSKVIIQSFTPKNITKFAFIKTHQITEIFLMILYVPIVIGGVYAFICSKLKISVFFPTLLSVAASKIIVNSKITSEN